MDKLAVEYMIGYGILSSWNVILIIALYLWGFLLVKLLVLHFA